MVDWSANKAPKTGADSIWVAYGAWDGSAFSISQPLNPSTRTQAVALVRRVAMNCLRNGRSLMVGFDFPFAYPSGLAAVFSEFFGGVGPEWRQVWRTIQTFVRDDLSNRNNRFEAANDINELTGFRFYWGRPRGNDYDGLQFLPERNVIPSGLLPNPCATNRLVESRAAKGIKSAWQLFGGVTVGSQTLVGLPHLERLRAEFADDAVVWPFETSLLTERSEIKCQILFVEIWPSAMPVDRSLQGVMDAAQVHSVVRWCSERDIAGDWARWLAPVAAHSALAQVHQEGWILGVC